MKQLKAINVKAHPKSNRETASSSNCDLVSTLALTLKELNNN